MRKLLTIIALAFCILSVNAAPKGTTPSASNLQIIPFAITEGTTSKTVKLNLNNPGDEFTAFQCDIYFPAGINWATTVDKRGNVKYTQPTFDAEADRTDASYHTVDADVNVDGSINIIVYSTQAEVFLDEEGAILDLPFVFDENLAPGVYDIAIRNVVITRVDETDVKPADYTFSVVVGSPEVNTITLHGNYTTEALSEVGGALSSNNTLSAIDFSEAAAVSGDLSVSTGNPNVLLYVADGISLANSCNVVVGDECENLVLTDGGDFYAPKAFTAVSANYNLAVSASLGYKTLVLPFDWSVPVSHNAYEVTGVNNGELEMSQVYAVSANTPVIVENAGSALINATNVTIAASGAALTCGELIGTYEKMNAPTGSYVLQNQGGEVAFYLVGEEVHPAVGAFRAYLKGSNGGARRFALRPGVATSISNVNADSSKEYYNLAGQRVEKSQRGINIIRSNDGVKKIVAP